MAMQEVLLSVVYPPFLCQFTCCLTAFNRIGSCQSDADSAFVDLEAQAAMLVIIGLLAQFREFGCVFKQPLL